MRRALFVASLACLAVLRLAAQTTAGDPVHVTLRAAGGRTSFVSGEPIRLEMVVTADRPGYVLDVDGPDDAGDEITITPADGTHRIGSLIMRDTMMFHDLSAEPAIVPLTLNYWVRFDQSGDYTVRVVTRRVLSKDSHGWMPDSSRPPLNLQSGELKFHVEVLDELHERSLVGPALAHIDASASADLTEQIHAAEELAFLPGDAAAIAKYQEYRALEARAPSNAHYVIQRGFAMSRRPSLILEQFERELSDNTRPLSAQSINDATSLRVLVEYPEFMAGATGPLLNDSTDPWIVIKHRYVEDGIATLPARAGQNRIESAIALLRVAGSPRPDGLLDIVVAGFGQLPIGTRYDLMISVLHEVRDPRLTAALSRAAADAAPEYVAAFIEALAVRDPAAVVGPIINALGDPKVILMKSAFEKAPPGSLAAAGPGIVAALKTLGAAAQKNQFRIEQKAQALELVADRSVLADVQSFYDVNQAQLNRAARAHFIAYLARWDAKNGAALLRKAVLADGLLMDQLSGSTGLPGFDQLCRERLFDADIDVASASAQALRVVGLASDQALIEQRLTQWRDAFRTRAAAAETDTDGWVESGLFTAATEGHQWKLAGAEWDRVHAGCVTDRCRALKR